MIAIASLRPKGLIGLFSLCLLPFGALRAQELGGAAPNGQITGTSASTGRSAMGGILTVDPYTGVGQVNLPLVGYQSNGKDFGLSLSYRTDGVKVDEVASAVGLHWQLSSAASIAREIKDIPDEMVLASQHEITYTPYERLRGRYAVRHESGAQAAETDTYRDRESDEFNVNLNGRVFTFYIGLQGYYTVPETRVRIVPLHEGRDLDSLAQVMGGLPSIGTGLSFRIIDEQGDRYDFVPSQVSGNQVRSDYYTGYLNARRAITGYYESPVAWALQKVRFANGQEILYHYEAPGDFIGGQLVAVARNFQWLDREYMSLGHSDQEITMPNLDLVKIQYPNGTSLELEYDSLSRKDISNSYALRSVVFRDAQQNCIRYRFEQNYLHGGSPEYYDYHDDISITGATNTLRLNLLSVSREDCMGGGGSEPLFSFGYESRALAARLNGNQDWFGYFNGQSPIPYTTSWTIEKQETMTLPLLNRFYGSGVFGLDRSSSLAHKKAWSLNKITQAKGGWVSIEYDEHVAATVLSGLPQDSLFMGADAVAGLRLRSFTEQEPYFQNSYVRTEYSYSGGQRFLAGGYFHTPYEMLDDYSDGCFSRLFQSGFLTRHQTARGAYQGYSNVEVTVSTEQGQLSRQRLAFTNFMDATSNGEPRYQVVGGNKHYYELPYTNKQYIRDWEMGLPLEVADYDGDNRPLSRVNYFYDFSIDSTSSLGLGLENMRLLRTAYLDAPVVDTFADWGNLDPITNQPPRMIPVYALRDFRDTYRPYRGKAELRSMETYRYLSNSDYIVDGLSYTYDGRGNLLETIAYDSDGSESKTVNVYNYDVPGTGGALGRMASEGIERLVGTEFWKDDRLVDASINTFAYVGDRLFAKDHYRLAVGGSPNLCLYKGACGGLVPPPYQNLAGAFDGMAPAFFHRGLHAELQDEQGLVLEAWDHYDRPTATIYDPVSQESLAVAVGARYTDVAYASFEEGFSPSMGLVTQGNWTYNAGSIVPYANAPTGSKVLQLSSLSGGLNGTQDLQSGKEYVLSFWSKNDVPQVYQGGSGLYLSAPVYQDPSTGWSHYVLRFTPSSKGPLQLSAYGSLYLDELRLHPGEVAMTSRTVSPLNGISSTTDARGRIAYREADVLGKTEVLRDQEGNILSKTETIVQGND